MKKTMADIKAEYPTFFTKDAMRLFNSRVESGLLKGGYFVTSEQCDDSHPRLFTVRWVDRGIHTLGRFQQFKTKADAKDFVRYCQSMDAELGEPYPNTFMNTRDAQCLQ